MLLQRQVAADVNAKAIDIRWEKITPGNERSAKQGRCDTPKLKKLTWWDKRE